MPTFPSINAHWRTWKRFGASATVVEWLRYGVRVAVTANPPGPSRQARLDPRIREKLNKMAASGVIERVPESSLRHSAPLFPVPKGSGIRVIHDLRRLNDVTAERRVFRLFGVRRAIQLVRKDDWMIKIDLQSGYHQLGVAPDDRSLLGIVLPDGTAFQYRVLGFGWTAAPYHFQTVTTQLARIIGTRFGVRVNVYLDDFLFVHEDRDTLARAAPKIIDTMLALGVIPSTSKSELVPTRSIVFLGIVLDSADTSIRIAPDKASQYAEDLQAALETNKIRLDRWRTILGRLSFFASTAQAALLKLRALQRIPASSEVNLDATSRQQLHQWSELLQKRPTRSFAELRSLWGLDESLQLSISTDASQDGWGACLYTGPAGQTAQGTFPEELHAESINVKELYAIEKGVHLVPAQKKTTSLTVFTDNTAAKAWLNKQGSTSAPEQALTILGRLAYEASRRNLTVRAAFTPGHTNVTADRLSRFGRLEWRTPRAILETIQRAWGPVDVDATATPDKTLTLPGFSRYHWSLADRGLEQDWRGQRVYLAPPMAMIGEVAARLERIRTSITNHPRRARSCAIILVPDTNSEHTRQLCQMTTLKMRFSLPESETDGYELASLPRRAGKTRMIAMFIQTASCSPQSVAQTR